MLNEGQINKLLRFANEVSIGVLGDNLTSTQNSQQETFVLIEFLTDARATPEKIGVIIESIVNSRVIDLPAKERGPKCSDRIDNDGDGLANSIRATDCQA